MRTSGAQQHKPRRRGARQVRAHIVDWQLKPARPEVWVELAIVLKLGQHDLQARDVGGVERRRVAPTAGAENGSEVGEGHIERGPAPRLQAWLRGDSRV